MGEFIRTDVESILGRIVDAVARSLLGGLDWDSGDRELEIPPDPPPAPEAIEFAAYNSPAVTLGLRVAILSLWPEWGHCGSVKLPPLESLVIDRAHHLCGLAPVVRDGEYGA